MQESFRTQKIRSGLILSGNNQKSELLDLLEPNVMNGQRPAGNAKSVSPPSKRDFMPLPGSLTTLSLPQSRNPQDTADALP